MLPCHLVVLGPPELRSPSGDPVRFRTRKHFALLLFLAVEPSAPHRRDRLATLLWPDVNVEEARHSLATALSVLRGKLGTAAFETTRDTVRLLPHHVVTDLACLEADRPDDAAPVPGVFLEEFDIAGAPDFQLWKDAEQARLRPLLHRHLARRIEQSRRCGDSRLMEALAHRLLRVDALNEEAIQALVEARAMAGDRIGGLRVYDRWRARLAEELGAQPTATLDRLADRLRRRNWERPATGSAPVPTEQWQERVFVGRGGEFRTCYEAWERVRTGLPRHVLVRGESGIGKTTLVERVATSLALEGASVARVQCYQLERELPFGVVGGLVNLLLDLPGASATPPEQLAELGRLVPKVRQRYPGLPAPLPTVGESARITFTEAVMALMAAIAEEHPVVLAVDDIHLADATSLAVLHLILRRVESMPLMVMLTSAITLDDETPEARRFVDNAASIGLVHLALGPLSERDSAELLAALVGTDSDPGSSVRRAILASARGNPMVLELMLADWRRRGDACLALTVSAMTPSAARPPREAVRRLVEGTLASLDAEARSVVGLAAILGQRLNDLAMYTLVDLPVARTMRAMTHLASQRIFRDAGNHLEFANEFVRSQCYVAMPAPLRRMLHTLVADRLLAQAGVGEPIPGLEVAWHLVRADRLPEAVPHLLAGGRESIRRGAPHEADLALSTGLPALSGQPRRTAILLLAEALQELGRWADSLKVLDEADEEFSEEEECAREVLRIICRRWLGSLQGVDIHLAAERLCDIGTTGGSLTVRVRAAAAVPYMLTMTRNKDCLDRLRTILASLSREELEPYEQLHLLLTLAWVADQDREMATARQIIDDAVALVDSTGTASTVAIRILVGSGIMNIEAGQYESALSALQRAAAIARRIENELHLSVVAAGLAVAEGRVGNVEAQLDWATTSINALHPSDCGIVAIAAHYERSLALAFDGQSQAAVDTILELRNRMTAESPAWAAQAALLTEADIQLLVGRRRAAIKVGRKAVTAPFDTLLLNDFAGPFARWKALIAMEDHTQAEAFESLTSLATRLGDVHAKDQVEVLGALCLLEQALGMGSPERREEAQSRLDRLPKATQHMLHRLGVLHSVEGWTAGGELMRKN
jgi:DNA-binding SARP family transcriptional activator/tetratricopeptide (TPR) repeat protein